MFAHMKGNSKEHYYKVREAKEFFKEAENDSI